MALLYTPSPTPATEPFYQCDARHAALIGGIGSGKTFALYRKLLDHMLGPAGSLGPALLSFPSGAYAKRVGWAKLRQVIDLEYRWDMGKGRALPLREGQRGDYWIAKDPTNMRLVLFPNHPRQSREILIAIRDDPDKLAGVDAVVHFADEILKRRNRRQSSMEEAAWNELNNRVRAGRKGTSDEAYQLIRSVGSPECGSDHWWVQNYYNAFKDAPGFAFFRAKSTDNPFAANDANIDDIKRRYAAQPHMVKALLEGEFYDRIGDRVFNLFDAVQNVKLWQYNPHLPLLVSFDFNKRPFSACTVWQTNKTPDPASFGRDGLIYGLREYVIHNGTVPEIMARLTADYRSHKGGVYIYGDSNGAFTNVRNGVLSAQWGTVRAVCDETWPRQWHPRWLDKNPELDQSIERANLMFWHPDIGRRLFVHPSMGEMLKTLTKWIYEPNGAWRVWDHPLKHFGDSLRYMLEKVAPNPYAMSQPKSPAPGVIRIG